MNKISIVAISITILVSVVIFFYSVPSVKFVPIVEEQGFRNNLIEAPELLSDKFKGNLQIVLSYYEVKYRMNSNSEILITFLLSFNKELIWNYTTKALDAEFVESHKNKVLGD